MTLSHSDTVKRFREKYVIDPAEVFFGDKAKLAEQGWEVGPSKLIIRQDATPEQIEQFIQEVEQSAEKQGWTDGYVAGHHIGKQRGIEEVLAKVEEILHKASFTEEYFTSGEQWTKLKESLSKE